MAHITEADGHFTVRWRLANGKHRQKRFATKRTARQFAATVAVAPIDTKASRTTFDQVARDALAAKQLKPRTLAGYERIVDQQLRPVFGGCAIAKVDRNAIVAWQATLPTNRAGNTTRNWVMVLSKIMRYAHRQGLITSNPIDAITWARSTTKFAPCFLTATEVEKLALAFDDDDEISGTLVRFAAWTGLRAGELTALTVSDLDLRRGIVSVTKTARRVGGAWEVTAPKSARSNREVPLAPHVVAMLRDYLSTTHPANEQPREGASAPLWPGRMKGGLTPGAVDWTKPHEHGTWYQRHFKPATIACGLAPLRFHDLRHTFASLCAEAGVPIHKVSRWMGHANVSTTDMIYTHLFTDHSEDLAKLTKLADGS